jgi:heme-degrading monooxygenase HmoA
MMHARFLRFALRPGVLPEFSAMYADRIFPALGGTEGCLGAALLVNARRQEEIASLTLWLDRTAAAAYDGEGRFARLLNLAEHLMEEGPEAAGGAFPEHDLAVEGYDAELLAPPHLRAVLAPGGFARTISAEVAPDRSDDFDRRYRAESATALVDFPGLRAVMLLHRTDARAITVGLSFWDGEESAARYELSGRFEGLAAGLGDTLSPLYRWRRSLAPDSPGGTATGRLEVDGYLVRRARAF